MRKSLIIAIIASLVSTLVNATWSGLPSGFDVIVCPPGGRPVR